MTRIAVSFVCTGNICRSPTAEAVMRHLVRQAGLAGAIAIDSAGTGSWHVARRATSAARRWSARGMPFRARRASSGRGDFERFDYVLALDRENFADLVRLAPDAEARAKVHLLREFDPASPPHAEVPDPYYGDLDGFERVFDICEAACRGLLDHLRRTHGLG